MTSNKGPTGVVIERTKAMESEGEEWIWKLLEGCCSEEGIPSDREASEMVAIYKQKRDTM